MPRANRYWVNAAAYHLTHRCHNREFLLRFAADRNAYRELLKSELRRSPVSLLQFTITCNHVHLLVTTEDQGAVASLMQRVQGRFAEAYNRRKGRVGAFWSDRYHATLIGDPEHLWACMLYIDLNMVRAGAVRHPRDWAWTGWHELTGERKRNRLIDLDALAQRFEGQTLEKFQAAYRAALDERLAHGPDHLRREPHWTESLAVGNQAFIENIEAQLVTDGKRTNITRFQTDTGAWSLRENPPIYTTTSAQSFPLEPIFTPKNCA